MSPGRWTGITLLACGLASAHGEPAGPGPSPLTLVPARVEIGLFYSGVDLEVSAETEPGADVALLITGPASELLLREQARRWGLFWAPAGEVTFDHVPSLYLLRTTRELEDLASPDVLEELGVGYPSVLARLGQPVPHNLFRELVVLKESEGLFSSTVAKSDDPGASLTGTASFRAVAHIPARASADTYSVQVFAFRHGRLVDRVVGAFEIEEAGFVDFVSSLAETHGLAYGVFAVAVAVASGLLVGFLFGSTRKKT